MSYAKYHLEEASRQKAFGKHKKVRTPILCMRDEMGGDNAHYVRDDVTSVASLRRSSSYRAAEEVAAGRTAVLEAEDETERASARPAETRAECMKQHKAMATEIEAVQCCVKDLSASSQQQTVQSAKMEDMGYWMEEMKDVLLQRELRLEVQMSTLYTQMNALSVAARGDKPKPDLWRNTDPSLAFKLSAETVTKARRTPEASYSSATLLASKTTTLLTRTQDRGESYRNCLP